jgi:hypothetical protein
MRHQHEESDARSGAEQDDGTQHMDVFQQQIFHDRPTLAQTIYPQAMLASLPDREHDDPTRNSQQTCLLLVPASRGMSDWYGGAKPTLDSMNMR